MAGLLQQFGTPPWSAVRHFPIHIIRKSPGPTTTGIPDMVKHQSASKTTQLTAARSVMTDTLFVYSMIPHRSGSTQKWDQHGLGRRPRQRSIPPRPRWSPPFGTPPAAWATIRRPFTKSSACFSNNICSQQRAQIPRLDPQACRDSENNSKIRVKYMQETRIKSSIKLPVQKIGTNFPV